MSNPGNIAGGHKANLANPNTSEESKEHSKEVLASMGVNSSTEGAETAAIDTGNDTGKATDGTNDDHETRVLAGHKATLSNPNASEEAKERSKEILEQADEA